MWRGENQKFRAARGPRRGRLRFLIALLLLLVAAPAANVSAQPAAPLITNAVARVISVDAPNAIINYEPNDAVVDHMVAQGITALAGKTNLTEAWRSLVSPQDVVGIKVFSQPGEISGTRPAVVAAVIRQLLATGVPTNHIIIWDKHAEDLRAAGYYQLAAQLHVRIDGIAQTGYDPTNSYHPDTPVIGQLVWSDLEFGKKGDGVGRRSFVSRLVSREMTKIISIAPLLNQPDAGTCGHLYSVALGGVDNTLRFEGDADRLAVAVPEIYALSSFSDKVVLNITDALIGQYEGGAHGLLHYSSVLNQLWFSRDPVALDTLAIKELDRRRRELGAPEFKLNLELYSNAALLELGINDPAKIHVDRIQD
ncbi:MAG TPA: hypothetical protein VFV81_06400 [Verrucomicrobiae bacterium]|nr:hypothetical protein [Verrucomicrobiae bacterium]